MTDGVIKGLGNSRFLKSSISADMTLEEMITMLRNGTFPIDLNGINSAGWTTLATALNKANLLDDTVAEAIATFTEQTEPTTVNDAFAAFAATARVKAATGSYTGTGTYGSNNPNSLPLPFEADIIFLFNASGTPLESSYYDGTITFQFPTYGSPSLLTTSYTADSLFHKITGPGGYGDGTIHAKKSADGKTIYWYHDAGTTGTRRADSQFNESGKVYHWKALKF